MGKALSVVMALVVATGCSKKKDEEPREAPKAVERDPGAKPAENPAPAEPKPDPNAALVARGAYLAGAAACGVCHTAIGPTGPDFANAYAGGLEMPDAIGTWVSPNITQDKGTGIGAWTDDQIARSIREGVRPDNAQLYPIMPYLQYNRLTDDDTKALVAFLRTVKPVNKVISPNKDLKMPKIPAPKPANVPDDVASHGEYMATIMLCAHCHWTPDKNLAPQKDKEFSGGMPFAIPALGKGTMYARNITSDPETGIGKWTEDQIFTVVKTMTKPDGKVIQGPMQFMLGPWSQLDDKDLHAVAAFIKKLPPVVNKVPDSTFVPAAGGPPPPADSGAPAPTGSGSAAGSAAPAK